MLNCVRETEQNKALGTEVRGNTAPPKDNHAVICCGCEGWDASQSGGCDTVCVFSPSYLMIKELCMVRLSGYINHSTFSSSQLCINLSVQV